MVMGYDPTWPCYTYITSATGRKSSADHTHVFSLKNELNVNGKKVTLSERNRAYSYHFSRLNKYQTPYRECPDEFNADCPMNEAGTTENTYEGNISEDFTSIDSTIVYMDLRHDLIVYKEKKEHIYFSGSNNALPGRLMIVLDFEQRIRPYTPGDVVGITVEGHHVTDETINVLSSHSDAQDMIYQHQSTTTGTLHVGVSDHSGFTRLEDLNGGYAWETYGVVDTSYPYSYEDGFVELYHIPQGAILGDYTSASPYEYTAVWNLVGDLDVTARYDDVYRSMKTTDMPIEVVPELQLLGSFAFDRDNNYFASMIVNRDTKNVYYKLTDGDPIALTKLKGDNPVFFPIAPA